MPANPSRGFPEAEFVPVDGAVDELVSLLRSNLDVKAVSSQESIRGGEGDPLIAA